MKNIAYFLTILLLQMACREPYESPVVSPETGYLVVEGAINSGEGLTEISLSRTVGLESRETKFELYANVRVEAEDLSFIPLLEQPGGKYIADNLNLDGNRKYRLNIKTQDGKAYLSEFLNVKKNPAIDSISWVRDNAGVQMNINTHDTEGDTRYYKWEYTETWEQFSEYKSVIEYHITRLENNDTYEVVYRDPIKGQLFDSTMYYCWQEQVSTQLLLGTSAQLSKDEINLPIARIPSGSIKLNQLYSIKERQLSLQKEAYEFFEVMKKNSESTGSIFDPQPAVLYGNMYNPDDSEEPVIGYMTICPIQEKRIFIEKIEVPNWKYFSNCSYTIFNNNSNEIRDDVIESFLPISAIQPPIAPFPGIPKFYASSPECVNCRLNGSPIKPDFWPNNYFYE